MNLAIIQQRIFEVRGQKVMLDFDLAALYEVETRVLNQAIKRNLDIFPADFMFQITLSEWEAMSSQFVMTSGKRPKSALPYAFTEHGVTMLATVLKSPKARKMNVAIVRAFIALKSFLQDNNSLMDQLSEIKERISEHDIQLNQIYDAIENLLDQKGEEKKWSDRQMIGFKSLKQ